MSGGISEGIHERIPVEKILRRTYEGIADGISDETPGRIPVGTPGGYN